MCINRNKFLSTVTSPRCAFINKRKYITAQGSLLLQPYILVHSVLYVFSIHIVEVLLQTTERTNLFKTMVNDHVSSNSGHGSKKTVLLKAVIVDHRNYSSRNDTILMMDSNKVVSFVFKVCFEMNFLR